MLFRFISGSYYLGAAVFFAVAAALQAGDTSACIAAKSGAAQQFAARQFTLAEDSFARALASCSSGDRVLLLLDLGQTQLVLQHSQAALHTAEQVLALDARNTRALKLKSDVLYLLGNDDDAARPLSEAANIEPENPEFPYALGRIYYQQHRYAAAIPLYLRAIALDPKMYKAYDNLGLCYEATGENEKAAENYTKALDLVYRDHRDYDWVYANYSELLMKLGRYEQAFQFAAEASARNPASARDCYLTGKALSKLGKWQLSIRWFRRAADLDSAYAEPHYLLAQAYRKQGAEDEARRELAVFQRLAASQPREHR